jgi:uncharacterized membrane protein
MKDELLSWVLAVFCVALLVAIIIILGIFYYAGVFILVLIAIWITKKIIKDEFFYD